MQIDSHQHFWQYSRADYPWIGPESQLLAQDYLPVDLEPHVRGEGIGGTVAVQARQTLEESRWLLELAATHPLIQGVVGWVDLQSEQVAEQLQEFSGCQKFVGVRHVVQDEPDPRFLLGSAFVRGLSHLQHYGLTYDLLLYPEHLPAAVELAALLPEQPFVLDHSAKPRMKTGRPADFASWQSDLIALASQANVCCKVSGLVTEAAWKTWKRDEFVPYLEVVLAAFGPHRLMFGSDWPVCLLSAQYAEVALIVREFFAQLSGTQQDALWGGTAKRFYNL